MNQSEMLIFRIFIILSIKCYWKACMQMNKLNINIILLQALICWCEVKRATYMKKSYNFLTLYMLCLIKFIGDYQNFEPYFIIITKIIPLFDTLQWLLQILLILKLIKIWNYNIYTYSARMSRPCLLAHFHQNWIFHAVVIKSATLKNF